MANMFMDMVNEKRIDVPALDGKKGGAYCAGVVPGIGPFQVSILYGGHYLYLYCLVRPLNQHKHGYAINIRATSFSLDHFS